MTSRNARKRSRSSALGITLDCTDQRGKKARSLGLADNDTRNRNVVSNRHSRRSRTVQTKPATVTWTRDMQHAGMNAQLHVDQDKRQLSDVYLNYYNQEERDIDRSLDFLRQLVSEGAR